jgi:proteasome accessory factor B
VAILQSDRFPNARALAEACEVSRRTVHRDLQVLADAGIPVRHRPEKQGYQIAKGFFLPPTNLTEPEGLALTVVAHQWKAGDALGLLRHAHDGVVKLLQGLPADLRDRVLTVGEPFLGGPAPSEPKADRGRIYDAIRVALARQRQLRIWYRVPSTLVDECTKFSVYRVLLHDRHWFLVGRSSLHRRVEVIGLSWVSRAEATDDRASVPPRFRLERFLAHAWGVERGARRYRVWLRFSPRVAPLVRDQVWHPTQREMTLPDGRLDVHFVVDGLDEILRWVLGFGEDVEVLAPEDFRNRLFEVASQVARIHQRVRAAQVPPPSSVGA